MVEELPLEKLLLQELLMEFSGCTVGAGVEGGASSVDASWSFAVEFTYPGYL
jgi:hypothetical protein